MSDLFYEPPNMEKLVSQFLRNQAELAALVGDRIYTAVPPSPKFPHMRVTQIIDVPSGSPLWAVAFDIQVEAWGSKDEGFRAANLARALLDSERFKGEHPGLGVVNGVDPGSMLDLPDEDYEPAKPRFLFTSTIYAHSVGSVPLS